jgi:hypothetical protein
MKFRSYYLSDTAVRQIGHRLVNTFYKEEETSWLSMSVDRIIRVAQEIELQLSYWYVFLVAPYTVLENESDR